MIRRYRKEPDGSMVEDETGDWVSYVDYLADEGNWVPFEDYKTVNEQFRELLESLRGKNERHLRV